VCVCAFSLRRESSDRILGDKPLIFEVVLSQCKIWQNMLTTQSWQKSYADVRQRDLEFVVGDEVLHKVSLMKGIVHFGIKGKLRPDTVDHI
jgi:hypothetical protein